MSELGEATSVLNAVAEIVLESNVRIKINTVALSDGMYTFSYLDISNLFVIRLIVNSPSPINLSLNSELVEKIVD